MKAAVFLLMAFFSAAASPKGICHELTSPR